MKKIQKSNREGHRSRLVKQLLLSWVMRKKCPCHKGIERILEIVKDIRESIEIMAREMARKAKKEKQK